MNARTRVVVAMSGGVDSSVAAALLVERGYDVVGVFMRVGRRDSESEILPIAPSHQGCCSAVDAADARRVAGRLGIPFYALNFESEFDRLIDRFADEYAAARTPNPCVLCNQWLKFGRLIDYANTLGASRVATGHFARVELAPHGVILRRGLDPAKDQSYVLFGVPADALRRTLFPLGELTKSDVRATAKRLGLPVHDKPESQDICFAPDRDYAGVVRARRADAFRPGEIRHRDGRIVGRHPGLPNFTIGQRHGLRIALGAPVYVTHLDPMTNTVTVGPREDLACRTFEADDVRWIGPPPGAPFAADVKIRYNHAPAPARIAPLTSQRVRVTFDEPQSAVAPGQAAVVYSGDVVLGGGWIDRSNS
ncbi:MAG: tRNA 2-thiouridine(34) synthase MnmA [Phycisphaerae bacterium]|nr:tRNA 2-thiouridine(34) synthase MnmA [Phycisphaerae bacterium]